MFKVYIIVLNYRNATDTLCCLDSLQNLEYENYEIIIVDNASMDNSVEMFQKYIKDTACIKISLIEAKKNLGYAAGNNIAIRHVLKQGDMDYVWILNNDTLVKTDSLTKLVKHAADDLQIGLCGSKLIYAWDKSRVQGVGGRYNRWLATSSSYIKDADAYKIDYVIGASVLVSKSFLENIGLMSQDYFLYFEELDWVERAKGKYKIDCAVDSIVYHKEGASTGSSKNKTSKLSDYYLIRNRILFTRKYYWYCLPTVYFGLVLAIINRIRRKQYDRVFMIVKLMFNIKDKLYER